MCLMLMCSTCENGNDNHFYVMIQNQSDSDMYLCTLLTNVEGKCTLEYGGSTLEKNSVFIWQPFNISIEREMGSKSVLEFYLVNPNHYNEQGVFFDCDSITIKNDIVRHCRLTLEDLRRMNFTVTYP